MKGRGKREKRKKTYSDDSDTSLERDEGMSQIMLKLVALLFPFTYSLEISIFQNLLRV